MDVRKAKFSDFPEIKTIYEYAREYMRKTGNPNQWGTSSPPEAVLADDIEKGQLYVVFADKNDRELAEGELLGSFALIHGPDPSYAYIENGAWPNDEDYYVIHRIAGNGKLGGILHIALEEGFRKTDNIRLDTHADNKVMQHLAAKEGFTQCGTIYLENGDPRIAYQKVRVKGRST